MGLLLVNIARLSFDFLVFSARGSTFARGLSPLLGPPGAVFGPCDPQNRIQDEKLPSGKTPDMFRRFFVVVAAIFCRRRFDPAFNIDSALRVRFCWSWGPLEGATTYLAFDHPRFLTGTGQYQLACGGRDRDRGCPKIIDMPADLA